MTANTKFKALAQVMVAAIRASGYVVEEMKSRKLSLVTSDLTRDEYGLVYSGALLKACTKIVELEEENEALREALCGGPSSTLLQEEVAVAGAQEAERNRAEGLA